MQSISKFIDVLTVFNPPTPVASVLQIGFEALKVGSVFS
jgi:hypothetical protein